ncbi:MAG: hypothetical protein KAT34_02670 [Candidatus Aminicenantes bacterium]|nr:hypothetical protein [Candidatus Aminicenantes bacterium]
MTNKKEINFRLDKGQIECLDDVMIEVYRNKSPMERIKIASEMWESARQQISAILRSLHPDWQEVQINKEVIKRLSHENL